MFFKQEEKKKLKQLGNYIRGFIKYRDLLKELVSRDIKIRYRRSVLGMLWTILNPILMMCVFTIVFSQLFKSDIENFTVYFLCGNVIWSFMIESTNNALNSIVGNQSLIKKVYIPKYLFPVSKVMSSLVNLFFAYIAMILVMMVTRTSFHITMLLSVIPIFFVMLFSIGLGMCLATWMVFFRDVFQLYSVVTLAWMYLTPMFYPASLLEEVLPAALRWNPMYHYITYLRCLVLEGSIPGVEENLICLAFSIVVFVTGIRIFYRKQDKFILYI